MRGCTVAAPFRCPAAGDVAIYAELTALASVVVIDLVLAGDNAVVVGMAAAGLPPALRRKAIVIGIGVAALLRILFAVFTTELLNTIPIILAGGLLLLWVAWKLFRETRHAVHEQHLEQAEAMMAAAMPACGPRSDEHRRLDDGFRGGINASLPPPSDAPWRGDRPDCADRKLRRRAKTLPAALGQIVLADVSMSLDNVLAVAGTARHHLMVLVIGLALSVALMGMAATAIAGMLRRFPWISYLGLMLITWVAIAMIFEGSWQIVDFASQMRL
jgi:predicted tellurium resistance membrane protein TerC